MELRWIISLMCIFTFGHCKKSCKDSLNKKTAITMQNTKEKVKSCSRMVECYPFMCESLGGKGGKCCKECRKIEDLKCFDMLTECHSLPVTINGKKIEIDSCNKLVTKYPEFCDPKYKDFGGPGKACCKSCKGAKQTLVKCQPKGVDVNCFCYPKNQCDGVNILPCPMAPKKTCKKLGKDYTCCCQRPFWDPFCKYDISNAVNINNGKTQSFNPETDDMPFDFDDFFKEDK